eukprot:COSAG06_NODE_1688_length_8713_cov_4.426051_4_plen_459_part_00
MGLLLGPLAAVQLPAPNWRRLGPEFPLRPRSVRLRRRLWPQLRLVLGLVPTPIMLLLAAALLLQLPSLAADEYSVDDPNAPHTKQAIAFDKAGRTADALQAFRAAVAHETRRSIAERHSNLGIYLTRQARFDEAIGSMHRAIETVHWGQRPGAVDKNADALASQLKKAGLEPKVAELGTRQADGIWSLPEGRGKKKKKKKRWKGPRQQFALEVPRVTAPELAANETLMSGHHAYILTDAVPHWPATERWDLTYLESKVPSAWADFYPENMLGLHQRAVWLQYADAAMRLRQPRGNASRYMQLRLSLHDWEQLASDINLTGLPSIWTEEDWIHDCFVRVSDSGEEERDRAAIDNFFRVNQWNSVLIAEKGAGIFFHKDHLAASSWQAHIVGRKKWVLCPNSQARHFDGWSEGDGIDVWSPDYHAHPGFARAHCAKFTVEPGELLYCEQTPPPSRAFLQP